MKKKTFLSIVGGLGLFILLSVGFVAYFGSLDTAASWLNGESFSIEPRNVSLENREPGTEEIVTFRLKNLTSKEISVVGEKSSCSCAFSENIPITAKPKETVELKIRVKLPKFKQDYDQSIIFMVATPEKLEMTPVRITACIPNPLPMPAETEPATENEATSATGTASDSSPPAQEQSERKETDQ